MSQTDPFPIGQLVGAQVQQQRTTRSHWLPPSPPPPPPPSIPGVQRQTQTDWQKSINSFSRSDSGVCQAVQLATHNLCGTDVVSLAALSKVRLLRPSVRPSVGPGVCLSGIDRFRGLACPQRTADKLTQKHQTAQQAFASLNANRLLHCLVHSASH